MKIRIMEIIYENILFILFYFMIFIISQTIDFIDFVKLKNNIKCVFGGDLIIMSYYYFYSLIL